MQGLCQGSRQYHNDHRRYRRCGRRGCLLYTSIKILPPDINEGESGFSVIDGNIRYGLSAIKSLGKPVIEAIIEERNLNGPFISLKDFAARLSGKEVNKRTIESFIKAGTFDSFGVNRRQLMLCLLYTSRCV